MTKIDELGLKLYEARKAEETAKNARIEVEAEVFTAIAAEKPFNDRESRTVKTGQWKFGIKTGVSYKADVEKIRALADSHAGLPVPLKHVPAEWKLDETLYERLRDIDPQAFALVQSHVTCTPKKVAVTLGLA